MQQNKISKITSNKTKSKMIVNLQINMHSRIHGHQQNKIQEDTRIWNRCVYDTKPRFTEGKKLHCQNIDCQIESPRKLVFKIGITF